LRRRADSELFSLFLKPLWNVELDPVSGAMFASWTEFYGLDKLFQGLGLMGREPRQ
jgi:hypothetical protein